MDFAQEGGLVKSLKTFNFYEILTLQNRIGTSKYGGNYTRFIWEIEIETVRAGLPRMRSLLGWHMKGDADEMVKMRKQQNFENNLTRPFYAQSMATWHLKTSEKYDIDTKALPDGKVGAVSNTILMAYDKLLNLPELARTLDLGTPGQEPTAQDIGKLFNLKNLEESRKDLAGDAGLEGEKYLRLTPDNTINGIRLGDIFDFSTGQPLLDTKLQQLRFLKFINFYRANADDHGARMIRGVIGAHAAKLHGLVTTINGVGVPYNKTLAELEAFWYSNTLGISVRNAVFDERHQWESQLTGMHRWGQAGGRPDEGVKRKGVVGKYGNYWTINTFKRPFVEPMYAYRTTASTGSKTLHQVYDEAQKLRLKIDREIAAKADAYMEKDSAKALVEKKMKAIGDAQEKRIRNHEMKITDAKDLYETAWNEVRLEAWDLLLKQNEQGLKAYKEKAEELIFPDDTERRYQTDHYDRLYSLDKKIRLEGLKLDKYIKTVALVGSTFDADEFHRDMGQLITDFRYAFKEYGSEINFGEMVWDWDPVLEKSVKMRRGDSMFGKEVWDDPRFKDKHGNTNWDFVNTPEGRDILLRRLVGCYLIGQVLQHRELKRWSTDPRYTFSVTEDILDAIKKIPGVVDFGKNMRDVNVSEYFFDGMMGWIRKKSGTGRYGMYLREGISTSFLGTPGQKDGFMSGLGNSLGDVVKESFAPFS
jgi:hypothetical protein